jgi:hypothetical protein
VNDFQSLTGYGPPFYGLLGPSSESLLGPGRWPHHPASAMAADAHHHPHGEYLIFSHNCDNIAFSQTLFNFK